jgi:hypothetical protein
MRFSSRYHTRKRKSKSKSKRKPKRYTRKQKGGAYTFSRKIPYGAIKTDPTKWDDDAYYDLAGGEELLSENNI